MNAQVCSTCGGYWTKCCRDRGRLQVERDDYRQKWIDARQAAFTEMYDHISANGCSDMGLLLDWMDREPKP